MTLALHITRMYKQLYVKTSRWYSSMTTYEIGAKMLNFLSLLQSIWVLISTIYLKPMERLLGISVKRHQLYSSALKKCNAWWNELFQSRHDSLLCESATLQRRACLHLFLLFFLCTTTDSNSQAFPPPLFF